MVGITHEVIPADIVEDAFRISATPPDPRELILEVVG